MDILGDWLGDTVNNDESADDTLDDDRLEAETGTDVLEDKSNTSLEVDDDMIIDEVCTGDRVMLVLIGVLDVIKPVREVAEVI